MSGPNQQEHMARMASVRSLQQSEDSGPSVRTGGGIQGTDKLAPIKGSLDQNFGSMAQGINIGPSSNMDGLFSGMDALSRDSLQTFGEMANHLGVKGNEAGQFPDFQSMPANELGSLSATAQTNMAQSFSFKDRSGGGQGHGG